MLKNYLMTAYKVFMRQKFFTVINLLCIVLTLVVLMVVISLLQNAFHPRGVEGKSDRFLQVMTFTAKGKDNGNTWTSPPGYKVIDKYVRQLKNVEAVAAVSGPETVSIYRDDQVHELQMRRADAEYWTILDFNVLHGRLPSAEDVANGRFVAVINEASANKIFGVSNVVGKKLDISGQQFDVIGVVENVMQLNAYSDIWAPVTTYESSEYRNQLMGRFSALILAKSAADLPDIQKQIEAIAHTVVMDDPAQWHHAYFWADSKIDFFARSLLGNNEVADSGAGVFLTIIAALMLLFMLLPALNLINLNSGRIMERATEIGVRKAFGASSAQLVGQFIIENIVLAIVGGALSLVMTYFVLIGLEKSDLIPYLKVEMDGMVWLYSLLATVTFGVLSGVIPAWKMSRLDPVHALKGVA